MNAASLLLTILSAAMFIAAASAAKAWALADQRLVWLGATLILYTGGNLIMLRLVRDVGMGVALSLSAVIQLIAINAVAFLLFGESVSRLQGLGLVLAVAAVAMIVLSPQK